MGLSERKIESVIAKDDHGQRLDLWLTNRFTYRSRNQWQDLIKTGVILLNNHKTRSSRKLQENDVVTFIPPDDEEPDVDMSYEIIYEDQYFLVVNKSGNLPCHPAGKFYRHTLWYDLTDKKGDIYIVNRLDRETSGLVLVGKTSEVAGSLANLFSKGTITKKYYLLVHGKFPKKIQAEGYLQSDPESPVRKKRCFIQTSEKLEGEFAKTNFKCVRTNGEFSLVEALPKTGRLHQIRATSCSLGYPLVGDKIYGIDDTFYLKFIDNNLTDDDYQELLLPRQALHAHTLEFQHPITKKMMSFTAPQPNDMMQVI